MKYEVEGFRLLTLVDAYKRSGKHKYSLKYDRGMVMELEGDSDVRKFLKGNDKHRYLYVSESDGPKRHTQKATRSCDHGIVCGRNGRDRDDIIQEGHKGAVVSKDVSDNEAAAEGGEEGNKGKGLMKRATLMRACGYGRNLGKKMDKYKQDMLKWNNGVGEIIKQKLADTYQKMGCITVVEYYNLMLGEYSVELTNSRNLVMKLGHHSYIVRCGKHEHITPTNGRQPARPSSKRRESQTQGIRCRKCFKYDEVGHTRRTCRNPCADFNANYEGDVVEVENLLDGSYVPVR
ncbi:hypothetical protein Cgig2_024391 [Carnegiea gigantea]|uniref:Uncharacterized protein n=1 Tax=Carnegiea gigantea TaxID=171969 RepID=A0A9Q1GXG8_9CARY|nr:hypothetical protein Cgig2_024391 [Carnegiea gigantea]